jgi:PPP family 3-phenylpropionic acid transporter
VSGLNSNIPTGRAYALRLALFYSALFAALGVQLPFLPVWLAAKGLDPSAIGVVLAIPMLIRLLAIPIAAREADRRDASRGTIIVAASAAALGYCVLALAEGVAALVLAYALASAFATPLMPLADAFAVRGLERHRRAYGPVRLWGSAAFIAGSLGAGALLDVIGERDLIWLLVAAMFLTATAAWALARYGGESSVAGPRQSYRAGLLREPAFLAVAAAASLIQASHAMYYGFSTIEWQAAGLGGEAIGALWALGVLAEIALFALSGRIQVASTTLLMIGACGAAVRWIAMALDPPTLLLPALQCLHALSFGATHLGALGFLARAAPAGASARAQGYLAIALGLVMAMAMAVSGALYTRWGSFAYLAMAFAAASGGLCALAAARFTFGRVDERAPPTEAR